MYREINIVMKKNYLDGCLNNYYAEKDKKANNQIFFLQYALLQTRKNCSDSLNAFTNRSRALISYPHEYVQD